MTRIVPSDLLTALSQPEVQPFYAVEALFDDINPSTQERTLWNQDGYTGSNAVRLWTGYNEKTIAGNTYLGAGGILGVSGLEEVNDLSAKSVTVSLSGINSSIIAIALGEPYQRRLCRIYFGTADTDVIEIFNGFMNTMSIEDSGDTSMITMTLDSKLIGLERGSNRRYTHENHIARNPEDNFFSFVADIQDKDLLWGREREKD